MSTEAWLVVGVLVAAVVLFATERFPVDVVAMMVLAALVVLELVSPAQALSGFSSQATIAVAAMFVLSAGIQRTGALRVIGVQLARLRSPWLFTLVLMLLLGTLSAFINNTAAVAVLLPLVLATSAANKISASKVLIPMSYAAQMGGVCTLIGTSTNLLVNSLALDMGLEGFRMFEFALLGMAFAAVGFFYLMVVGRYLLPDRRSEELTENYQLGKYITELRVREDSPLVGKSVAEARLAEEHGVYVLELMRGDQNTWMPRAQTVEAGDVLLVRGDWTRLDALKERAKLEIETGFKLRDEQFETGDQVLTEVMIAPTSRLDGHALSSIDLHWQRRVTVLAIQRRGQVLREKLRNVRLTVGDILLMVAPEQEMGSLRADRNIIVLSEKEASEPSRARALLSLAIMAGVVATAALGLLPLVVSAIIGCILMVVTGCLDTEEAYDAIDWRVILLLAGILPLGIALTSSGAAGVVAERALELVGAHGPLLALAMIYLVTAVLTEMMSNNAAAVLLAPIAVSTAAGLGVDPKPFLVAVMFAASTSFATPVGYQTNTMVYNAGGYRFGDFLRIGVPLNLVFWALAVVLIPRFFPF